MPHPGTEENVERGELPKGERSRREWVELWGCSGVSEREFCRRNGLVASSFNRWKRELQVSGNPGREPGAAPAASSLAPAGWLPVRLRTAPQEVEFEPLAESVFEVVLRGDRKVRLGARFDAESLRRLVWVLESVPC